jgi:hypothetical protein
MSTATITLQPAKTVSIDLNNIIIKKITDNPAEFLITAGCKVQIFNSVGTSLGYIQVYSS